MTAEETDEVRVSRQSSRPTLTAASRRCVGVSRYVRRLYRALSSCACEAGSAFSDEQLRTLFDAWPRKGYVGTERLFRR